MVEGTLELEIVFIVAVQAGILHLDEINDRKYVFTLYYLR